MFQLCIYIYTDKIVYLFACVYIYIHTYIYNMVSPPPSLMTHLFLFEVSSHIIVYWQYTFLVPDIVFFYEWEFKTHSFHAKLASQEHACLKCVLVFYVCNLFETKEQLFHFDLCNT